MRDCLPRDEEGKFVAERERSDVVHDLRAFLAVLKKNRKKLAVDPAGREPGETLRAEFELRRQEDMADLRPMQRCDLALTYRLGLSAWTIGLDLWACFPSYDDLVPFSRILAPISRFVASAFGYSITSWELPVSMILPLSMTDILSATFSAIIKSWVM